MRNIEITCTTFVKHIGILLNKNLTYDFHVQRVGSKLARHVSVVTRIIKLCDCVMRYFITPILDMSKNIYI